MLLIEIKPRNPRAHTSLLLLEKKLLTFSKRATHLLFPRTRKTQKSPARHKHNTPRGGVPPQPVRGAGGKLGEFSVYFCRGKNCEFSVFFRRGKNFPPSSSAEEPAPRSAAAGWVATLVGSGIAQSAARQNGLAVANRFAPLFFICFFKKNIFPPFSRRKKYFTPPSTADC